MNDTNGQKQEGAHPLPRLKLEEGVSRLALKMEKVDKLGKKDGAPSRIAETTPVAPERQQRKWNTKNLGFRLGADALSAAAAASMVAPLISIIDRSIMENASGRSTLLKSLKSSLLNLLLRPHSIILGKPFALICMTYGGTYFMANALDTTTSTVTNKSATLVTSGTSKFAVSSATNTGLGIYKDQVFARMFGPPGATTRPVPLPSYLLFALRDAVTIFASFNAPLLLAPYISCRLSSEVKKKVSGQTIAQFAAPAAIQLVSTPPHLLGLDLYNRPYSVATRGPTMTDRWGAVRSNWAISVAARVCRIMPAFGIGGVVNFKVRRYFMERLV